MSVAGWLLGKGASGFGYNSSAEQVSEGLDLSGRSYLVTGCNSGLGAETLRVLSLRGARVIGAARSLDKAQAACAAISTEAVGVACELSEPDSVRACVDSVRQLGPLDGIIANAGIMALPTVQRAHGYELQFFTNHVGHFMLVTGLLGQLTSDGRVVMLSSRAHKGAYAEGIRLDDLGAERGYSPWGAYGQSKLANLLFAKHLATRLEAGQTANALHPGVIATNLTRHMNPVTGAAMALAGPLFLKTIPQGAATQVYLASHPGAADTRGAYFADCNVATPSEHGQDAALAQALWRRTEELVAGL